MNREELKDPFSHKTAVDHTGNLLHYRLWEQVDDKFRNVFSGQLVNQTADPVRNQVKEDLK